MKKAIAGLLAGGLCLLGSYSSLADQWVNPKEAIGDASIARLQQGRKELTSQEKEDLAHYGYTGLEIMTYVDDNRDPGKDWETFERYLQVGSLGDVRSELFLRKVKYSYRDHLALLTHNGIRPGDIEYKETGISLFPPKYRRSGWLDYVYLRARREDIKHRDEWVYLRDLRRNRRNAFTAKGDNWFGLTYTWDDYSYREPWEEDHRILGEDVLEGRPCYVVESNNLDPNYYLSRRVSWVDRERFLDLHEEQYDREGRLWKVINRRWEQIAPWGYWVRTQQDFVDILNKTRTVLENVGWIFDQGLSDGDFLPAALRREHIWRLPPKDLPPLNAAADFPPQPQERREFWSRLEKSGKGRTEVKR